MGESTNRNQGGGGQRRIDDEAKGIFLAAVKRGASLEDAARAAGFTLGAFWKARKRDPAFDEAVEDAMEMSNAPRFVAPGNGRKWQLKRPRRLRFVEWRQEVFLAHFALCCDETAAAEAAGVSTSTVCRHRQRDPDFAEAYQRALELGYPRLEAEAVRQRLEAQRMLREDILPAGEIPLEFDRMLKLLQRFERKSGKVGPRTIAHGRQQRWTFEEAIEALDRKLDALGIPIVGEAEAGAENNAEAEAGAENNAEAEAGAENNAEAQAGAENNAEAAEGAEEGAEAAAGAEEGADAAEGAEEGAGAAEGAEEGAEDKAERDSHQ